MSPAAALGASVAPAHHLQGLAQYQAVQTQHVWVLQVHHDGHLTQEVPQLCAHGAFRTHPEGLDSHWDLGVEVNIQAP